MRRQYRLPADVAGVAGLPSQARRQLVAAVLAGVASGVRKVARDEAEVLPRTVPASGQMGRQSSARHYTVPSYDKNGHPVGTPLRDRNEPALRFTIVPQRAVGASEFQIMVVSQIFGLGPAAAARLAARFKWSGPQSTAGVTADQIGVPVSIDVDASLYREVRSGADARPADTTTRTAALKGLSGLEQRAVSDEVDRRFWARTGGKPGTRLAPHDADEYSVNLWLSLRDDVLDELETLRRLPHAIQQALGGVARFRPENYAQLVRIAGKLAPAEWADYISQGVRFESLDKLEASVDSYRYLKRKRLDEATRYRDLQLDLFGMERIYQAYKGYLRMWNELSELDGDPVIAESIVSAEKDLIAALRARGFKSGIPEFESYLRRFITSFEANVVNIGIAALDQYAAFLVKQRASFQNDDVVSRLYDSLGQFRPKFSEYTARVQSVPHSPSGYPAHNKEIGNALEGVSASRAKVDSFIEDLAKTYPIFDEKHLPASRRIPRDKLAKADKAGVKQVLVQHIDDRLEDVGATRANLLADAELIYKLDQLMAIAKKQLDVTTGSIFDQLVRERQAQIKRDERLIDALIGVLAIAFTVMTFGSGAIAVFGVAGSLAVGGAEIYREAGNYAVASAAAGSGLSSAEPSLAWLVLSIAGVAFDAAPIFKLLKGPAQLLDDPGGLATFHAHVKLLERENLIASDVAQAVERAAAARKAYTTAYEELKTVVRRRAYSIPGPLADWDFYQTLVRMVEARIRQGLWSIVEFIAELKKAKVAAGMGELTDEELQEATKAFREGRAKAKQPAASLDRAPSAGVNRDYTKVDLADLDELAKKDEGAKAAFAARVEALYANGVSPDALAIAMHVKKDSRRYPQYTTEELAEFVQEVMDNPGTVSKAEELGEGVFGRTAYWSDELETVVITDPNPKNPGTVMKPDQGRAYYDAWPEKTNSSAPSFVPKPTGRSRPYSEKARRKRGGRRDEEDD